MKYIQFKYKETHRMHVFTVSQGKHIMHKSAICYQFGREDNRYFQPWIFGTNNKIVNCNTN